MTQNKIVLITGGRGYLGQTVSKSLSDLGITLVHIDADITNSEKVKAKVSEIISTHTNIDAIIHCASAPLVRKPLTELLQTDFQRQFDVNVLGLLNIYKAIGKNINNGGNIIGISSISVYDNGYGRSNPHNNGSYLLAKYALGGLLRQIATEIENRKIRVNAVAPAFMPGGLNDDMPEAVRSLLMQKMNKDETATGKEVANVITKIITDPEAYPNRTAVLIPTLEIKNL